MPTILVVDDEPSFRDIFYSYLNDRGYTVLTASDGQEAKKVCKVYDGVIDLLVIDLVLPQEDSRPLAMYLSSIRPKARILYVSAGQHKHLLETGILDPVDDFLEKPFALHQLEEILQNMINKKSA